MADRDNHYEAAFEEYIRQLRIPYIAVEEAKRALFAEVRLKSLDFIVYSPQGRNLLVDVKGRRFPSGAKHGRLWENWSTAEDVESLERWQQVFGPDFRSVLVFAYNIERPELGQRFADRLSHRGREYGFVGVALEDYREHMHVRSPRWGTVAMSGGKYRELRRALSEFL